MTSQNILQVLQRFGFFAYAYQHSRYATIEQSPYILHLFIHVFTRLTDQDIVAIFLCRLLDTI